MLCRDANLKAFFSHEVQSYRPSSKFGELRLLATKSDLLKGICSQHLESPEEFDCKIYDGAVIIHCLPVTGAVNFHDYAEKMFFPYIQSKGSRRIDFERSMLDCSYEEADTRIVVHILHAVDAEYATNVFVRIADTDVIVILVGKYHFMKEIQSDLDLLVDFGMGRNFRFINANAICSHLSEVRSRSLPVLHELISGDTTSSFCLASVGAVS